MMKMISDELYHHGIEGQRWGIRRYQYEDGTLTPAGRDRYGIGEEGSLSRNSIISPIGDNRMYATNSVSNSISKRSAKRYEAGRKMSANGHTVAEKRILSASLGVATLFGSEKAHNLLMTGLSKAFRNRELPPMVYSVVTYATDVSLKVAGAALSAKLLLDSEKIAEYNDRKNADEKVIQNG